MNTPPFTRTHYRLPVKDRRGSRVDAQLLSIVDGLALYRVRFKEGKREVVRVTSTSQGAFERAFKEAA